MKVTKGMRVAYINIDGTVSRGKVIGVGWTARVDGRRDAIASVMFDDFNEDTWFDEMFVFDLFPADHVFHTACECGNLTRMCHPHA